MYPSQVEVKEKSLVASKQLAKTSHARKGFLALGCWLLVGRFVHASATNTV